MPKINCAIYTRKSTEHGLDMEFNSLQNQEEACKAYILSQAFNQWEYYKTYSDGGISGGTMERPGLLQMLADIRARKIQMVVVYKVDRLSRSIIDFHKMMQEFDKYGCNFVSITQSFDTSNSMGKLTLNMLLSFAQFEREVSAERVRDKIAASKAKGLWMGGTPPLGYDVKDKALVPNPQEAYLVRLIYHKYLEIGNIITLVHWLNAQGYRSKRWISARSASPHGGKPFQKSSIQRILTNPVYIGQVAHMSKNKTYKGQHPAILPVELWEQVQTHLRRRIKSPQAFSGYQQHHTLLSGKLQDEQGRSFRITSSKKQGRQLLYYYNGTGGHYLPVGQLDDFALKMLKKACWGENSAQPNTSLPDKQLSTWISKAVCQTRGQQHLITLYLQESQLSADIADFSARLEASGDNTLYPRRINGSVCLHARFMVDNVSGTKLQNGTARNILTVQQINESLVRGLARAWQCKKLAEQGLPIQEIAKKLGLNKRTFARYMNLCYLAPAIVADILEYKNPKHFTLRQLMDLAEKESSFDKQLARWQNTDLVFLPENEK